MQTGCAVFLDVKALSVSQWKSGEIKYAPKQIPGEVKSVLQESVRGPEESA